MKKQLFSLMMLLALVVFAGTSAWAQNSNTAPEIMFAGATREYTVDDHSSIGNTYQWSILDCAGSGTVADPYIPGAASAITEYAITAGSVTSNTITLRWTETAAGGYCVQIAESNEATRGGCSTIRQFFVTVVDFDLWIYASDASGNEISDAGDLATCGSNATYNPWYNTETDLLDNRNEADGSAAAPYSTRYITAAITASGINFGSSAYSWQFPYSLAVGDDNYDVSIVPVNHAATTTVTYTDYQNGQITVGLEAGATVTSVTFEIRYQPKWANDESDITLAMTVATNSCVLDGSDTDTNFDDGVENADNYSAAYSNTDPRSNVSRTQTIYVSPATSIINIAD